MTGSADAVSGARERLKSIAAAAFGTGDFVSAGRSLQAYCVLFPGDAGGYGNLLAIERRTGQNLGRMERLAFQALLIAPDVDTPIISLLTGFADRRVPVSPAFRARLAARPRFGKLALAVAICHFMAGQADDALLELRRSLVLNPQQVALLRQAGGFLQNLGDPKAADYFSWTLCAALEPDEDYREALSGLAAERHEDGAILRSIGFYRSALQLDRGNASVRANLAAALVEVGEASAAEDELKKLLISEPENREGLWLSSCLRIGRGDRSGGYRSHHVRWSDPYEGSRAMRFEGTALWLGHPLEGKRILAWGDFGIGDEVLFAPLASWLAAQGASVVLEVDPRLVAFAKRSFPAVAVVARQDEVIAPGQFDFHVPTALIVRFYHRHSAPEPLDPWRADTKRVRALRSELGERFSGPLIGLAWGGGGKRTSWSKTTELAEWSSLLGLEEANFVSLQYVSSDGSEPPELLSRVRDAPVENLREDLDGLAALIAALDCVVSISGVNAHFAGALHRPGFILLPKQPLWFWGRSGDRSPWYPSLRIYRNIGAGWQEPIAALTGDVRRFLSL
ncbi:tetratricopeptide repeat-containing glycosyltransferase family protein [Nisaea acidiphila]|uniref:Tetratricopeptide repeat-containing glycosyltransferase family protein n=1 Tax=Nisaea acidiphila TaxID=1862145 RepID=A0A9J7AL63_9PROT|nr:tetratricopeptide repeat-containing glycosyltransferase family protein [Nisaea acidiphila]UUX48395.1 tetratricopeptide repeat-containing glycosyltransferase family protein [Nisaea acidiphila]